ncbi:Protein kinase-like domain superfamily [Sesbania bispinosa]|nr:Protein kinase-like domain superfamily [Sesbania bispinosa]
MEAFERNFTGCGVEKLTSGVGGCSDYTITDVINKLGDNLRKLDEYCMPLSINGKANETCTTCWKAWEDISARSESAILSTYLCKFAVLVSLTSTRIYERESIQAVYKCLGGHSLAADELEVKARGNANINPGVTVVVFLLLQLHCLSEELEVLQPKSVQRYIPNGHYVAVKHIIKEGYMETFVREVRSLPMVMDPGQSYVSSEVRGTFGYIDPEYRRNHHVNASGDVYSFGIVLLQLLSGQRVLNIDFQRPMSLSKMARDFARGGEISEFADPKLKGAYSIGAFEIILKLALLCIGLKRQRPSIEQVLYSLVKALDISL